ncbi:MAG: DNA-processing protein DprA [Holosporales bacterium]|nr:DNA-processing protein DprA [Holosporales bacterium]
MALKKLSQKNLFTTPLMPFDESEKIHWLRLIRCTNVGPVTFYSLLRRFGKAQEALKMLPEALRGLSRRGSLPVIPSFSDVIREYETYANIGAYLIAYPEPLYPELLRQIPDPPPLISVMGDLSLLKRPHIAIVGARNASAIGKKLTEIFSQSLGEQGFGIVSGLARGIDTHAHRAALKTGTIAVLAGGIDQIYPPENHLLYQAITREGLVLSESPLGQAPYAALFPRRNRLISGLSKGTLIVEAAVRSGSLVTAHYAGEQGREVFAIPGSPLDPRCQGSNQLIKEGAVLVQTPEDLFEVCPPPSIPVSFSGKKSSLLSLDIEEKVSPMRTSPEDFGKYQNLILENLSSTPIQIDILAQQMRLSVSLVRAALVEIEIAGYLGRHSGDFVFLLPHEENEDFSTPKKSKEFF